MTHDWTALREKAEKASRWSVRWYDVDGMLHRLGDRADAEFIAAANPTAIAALLDENERLRAEREEAKRRDRQRVMAADVAQRLAAAELSELRGELAGVRDILAEAEQAAIVNRDTANRAEAALDRVKALTIASDDGAEWEHNDRCEGEPSCPACWAADILRAIAGEV